MYIYIHIYTCINIHMYIYTLNSVESNNKDGPVGHKMEITSIYMYVYICVLPCVYLGISMNVAA